MGNSYSKRNEQNTSDNQVIQDFLNPRAENVNVHNVHVGCTIYGPDAQPSTSHINNIKKDEVDVRIIKYDSEEAAIRSTLKNLYEKIALPCLPWVKGTYVSMKYFTKLQLKLDDEQSTTEIIELHNLFDAVKKKNPRRILIDGQPGFGKTSLTHKIISDWVHEESYVKRFKFAFLIILRNYKSSTVKDEIFETIEVGNGAEDKTWRIINSEETLLIFDGLDEVSDNVKCDILEILFNKQNVCKMTIVVTCRAGSSQLKMQEEDDSKCRGVSMRTEFWSKKITILGINSQDGNQFLNNFVYDGEKDKIMPRLMEIINSKEEMFKSPLMLILLVYLMREDHEIKIKNNTDLYKQFADYIIRRSIAKTNPAKEIANFSLFDSSVNEYSSKFYKFGEMCWEQIFTNNLQFNPNADNEAIHQMGFLLKHETNKKFGILVHYEGFHLSILEFAAAVFLKKEFQENHNRFCDSLIVKILEICVKKGSFSLVIPFLCGLLGNDVAFFFDQLSDGYLKYWIDEELIKNILLECEINELISEYFSKIVPPSVEVNSSSALFTVINQHTRNSLDSININVKYLLQILTQPLLVRVLICNVFGDTDITATDVITAGENITCEYLTFNICTSSYTTFISSLKLFEKIRSRYKTLSIEEISEEIQACLQKSDYKKMIKGAEFDLFTTIFNNTEVNILKKIIKFNRVTNVCLATWSKDKKFRSFGNIDVLNSLCIVHKSYKCLNLYIDAIAENTGKKWEFLLFSNSKLTCKSQLNRYRYVKSLSINEDIFESSLIHDANVMLSVVPTALRCKSRALEALNNDPKASSWAGWKEIVELTLSMGERISEEFAKCFNNFSKFKNLKILTLEFFERRDDKLDVTDIVESISFLTLDRLEIRWLNIDYYEVIIRGIQNLILRNKISRVNAIRLAIVWDDKKSFWDYQFELELIQSALQCDDRISFTFYFEKWSILRECIQKCIPRLWYFNLKYAFIENNLASYTILSYFPGTRSGIHKLELTLH